MKKTIFLMAVLVAVCACDTKKIAGGSMQEKAMQMSEHCIGRHVMDLPLSFSQAAITTGIFKFSDQGADDSAIQVTVRAGVASSQFAKEMQKRNSELRDKSGSKSDVLRLAKTLSPQSTLFRVQRIDDAYVSELHFLSGTTWISAELDSYANQFLAAENLLMKFAASVKQTDMFPHDLDVQGFCLGPVVVMDNFKEESADFLFENSLEKGVDFELVVDTYRKDEAKSLLARISGPDSLLSKFDLKHSVLRKRELTVAGMRAEEWLASADLGEKESDKSLKFVLETMRPSPDKMKPSIHLTFETGQPLEDGTVAATKMSDEDAIKIWDAVVASIRPLSR